MENLTFAFIFADGLSKKKKRKLAATGNIYSGVSTTQLSSQAIDRPTADSMQTSLTSKNNQVYNLFP